MNEWAVLGVITILLVGVHLLVFNVIVPSLEEEKEKVLYQGAVPQGYDEEHFRLTGESKKING